MSHLKNKHGSDMTMTGVIRKLSYFSSASSMTNVERTEWYWDVISKAEYEGRSQNKHELIVSVFIETVLEEIEKLKIKEIKKGRNNGK